MKPKILVTGGAGYIGSIATEQLIKAGYQVIVFDNLSMGHRAAVHPDAIFVKGDLSVPSDIENCIATHHPEGVMHFAAYSIVGESMLNPMKYLRSNYLNGLNLLDAMLKHDVKKIIFSSTANLFDLPKEIPITEIADIIPGSPYGESKQMFERTLHWLSLTHHLRYSCLRYFNAAGASPTLGEDHHPELHLIPLILQVALGQRENITIYGDDYPTPDGTCIRDYIHVIDLANAHILAYKSLAKGNSVYNLGYGKGFSVKEVIETTRQVTGHSIPIIQGSRRAGDPAILIAGSDKIKQELGWTPTFDNLTAIIESAWNWHRQFPNGYKAN
jgi:UDP-glucose 4-epimerase